MIQMYLNAFPGVRGYMNGTKIQARDLGFVQTYQGRRRRLPHAQLSNRAPKWMRGRAERQAVNTVIQGSAHDIVKSAMISIDEDAYLNNTLLYRQVSQVHDELIGICPTRHADEAAEIVRTYMEDPMPFRLKVPLPVDLHIVKRWSDAK